MFGKAHGFAVEAILVPQPSSDHGRENLRVALAHGLVATVAPAWSLAPPLLVTRWERDAYFIRLGGSSALGSLGFVDAARELAEQVKNGELAEPDVIVVAVGSGGTAAGLAVGLERAGLKTRVLGVAVSPPAALLSHLAKRLAAQTATEAGLAPAARVRAAQRITIDGGWIGKGYGHPTSEGTSAMADAARAGITLDATYTAKAFAAALSLVRAGNDANILFWNTLSSAPSLLARDAHEPLPPKLERLFR